MVDRELKQSQGTQDPIEVHDFKGINRSKNPYAIDASEFSEAVNVVINNDGSVSKRPGTILIGTQQADISLAFMMHQDVYVDVFDKTYCLMTGGTGFGLIINRVDNYSTTDFSAVTYTTIGPIINSFFSSNWPAGRMQTLVMNEANRFKKVVWFNSKASPVEVVIITAEKIQAGGVTTVAFEGAFKDYLSWFTSTGTPANQRIVNWVLYRNGVDVSATVLSRAWDNATKRLTITLTGADPAGTNTYQLVGFVPRGWTPAKLITGDMAYQRTYRFNASQADLQVKIPDRLLYDMEPWTGTLNGVGRYPFLPHQGLGFSNLYGWGVNNVFSALNANNYVFSGYGFIAPALATSYPASPYYVTFGALDTSVNFREVHFNRLWKIPFSSGELEAATPGSPTWYDCNSWNVQNMKTNDVMWHETSLTNAPTWIAGGGGGNSGNRPACFGMGGANEVTFQTFTPNVVTKWVNLNGAFTIGLDPVDYYAIINHNGGIWGAFRLNGSLNTPVNKYSYGDHFLVYGWHKYWNYENRSFPSVADGYQNRLALSGMSHSPLLIAFSGVSDSHYPNEVLNNFQWEIPLVSDSLAPFEVEIPGGLDEFITAIRSLRDWLFVFTNKAVYLITYNRNSGIFSVENFSITKLAQVGAYNPRCVAVVKNNIYFFGQSGLYDVATLMSNEGDRTLQDLAVSSRVNELLPTDLVSYQTVEYWAYLSYDAKRDYLFLNYPLWENFSGTAQNNQRMLVYNLQKAAWTEWMFSSGVWNTISATPGINGELFFKVYFRDSASASNASFAYLMLSNSSTDFHMDYAFYYAAGAVVNTRTLIHRYNLVQVAASTQRRFRTDFIDIRNNTNMAECFYHRMSPMRFLPDARMWRNGVVQTFNTQWRKFSQDSIYFNLGQLAGDQVFVEARTPSAQFPIGMLQIQTNGGWNWIDDVSPYVSTASLTSPKFSVTLGALTGNIYVGNLFPCWIVSPTYTRSDIADESRVLYAYSTFQNDAESRRTRLGVPCNITKGFAGIIDCATLDGTYEPLQQSSQRQDLSNVYEPTNVPKFTGTQTVKLRVGLTSNAFQYFIYSFDNGTWNCLGYKVETEQKGKRLR